MSELVPNALHAEQHIELSSLIASSRQRLAGAVNAELTRLYWSVGERLRTEAMRCVPSHRGRGAESRS